MILNRQSFDGEVCCFCGLPITTDASKPGSEQGIWHHYDHALKNTEPELYKMTLGTKNGFTVPCHKKCHNTHHTKGFRHTEVARAKIRMAALGNDRGKFTKGLRTGCHWFNNGSIDIICKDCLEGFTRGRSKGRRICQ